MRRRLLDWLCCPDCGGDFALRAAQEEGPEVIAGFLACSGCGQYPIMDGIPRILASLRQGAGHSDRAASMRGQFDRTQARTQRSFGFQWTRFCSMTDAFEQNFLNYIAPLQPEFFRGRLVLDAGCGFGRHLYYAATYGAEVIGVDLSAAIDSARRNTAGLPAVHLVQCDLYRLPFRRGVFDAVYSIGVLHHLPDPEAAFRTLLQFAKPDAPIAVWVYSSRRRILNACLELFRRITTRLPMGVLQAISWGAGLVDWCGFILPYRLLRAWPLTRAWTEQHAWPRIKLYAGYPFEVCVADWFDRLAAPVRFYYDDAQLQQWCERQALTHVQVSPTGLYGWRVYGRRPCETEAVSP